jgi:hypothetical protein
MHRYTQIDLTNNNSFMKQKPVLLFSLLLMIGGLYLFMNSCKKETTSECKNLSGTLANGLVAYYPFCGNANDLSGNGLHGIVSKAILTGGRNGNSNSAYKFKDHEQITLPITDSYFQGDFTVSVWVILDSISSVYPTFVYGENQYFRLQYVIIADVIEINSYFLTASGNPRISGEVSSPIDPFVWTNVIITSQNHITRLYLNGVLFVTGPGPVPGKVFGNNLILGNGSGSLEWFNGKLDDFALWSRALTDIEITALNQL